MKSVSLILLLGVTILGCAVPKKTEIEFYHPLKNEVANKVVNSTKSTSAYKELCSRAERCLLDVDEEEKGWVRVDLYSVGKDFNHRWATMKVNVESGLVMKLGADENGEDKWTVDYDPSKS